MMDATVPAEPMPFRDLLDGAMKLTRRYFGTVYPSVAIPIAVITTLSAIVQLRWMAGAMKESAAAARAGNPAAMFGGCGTFLVTMFASLVVHGITYAVLTSACVDGAASRPISMSAKWAFVLQPGVIGTLLLAFLAVAAGLICLVLPGLYIGLMLSFVIPVMAAEGLRGGDALGRSWRLTRYNPHKRFLANPATKIFVLYLVAGLITYAVSFLIQLPFTAMQGYRMARTISSGQPADAQALVGGMMWWQLPSVILGSLVSTAVSVYTSFGLVLLYLDVVRRKEGGDLAAAIDARFPGGAPSPNA
jgi:hypothetical protein